MIWKTSTEKNEIRMTDMKKYLINWSGGSSGGGDDHVRLKDLAKGHADHYQQGPEKGDRNNEGASAASCVHEDQPETGDFAQIIFKGNIWKQRDPEVEIRTLSLTSYKAIFLMNQEKLMSEVKTVLKNRHSALVTNTKSDGCHDVKITVERRSGTLVDESKITEWKNIVCGVFDKVKAICFQKKFRIKQNDFEALRQLVSEKVDQRFHATYIPVPEESCVVVVCFMKDSEKLMADLSEKWGPYLAVEHIDPILNVQNFQSDTTDAQDLLGCTNARPKVGDQEDSMTVKLALVMDEDEYQMCKSQFPTWIEIASHLKTYKPVDIMAGKKMIVLEGQKKDVEVVVQRFLALFKEKTKSHHDHDEAAEYMKPVIVTEIANTHEIRMALEIPEALCCLLLTSQMIQNDSLKNMLKKEIVSSIESDGKHLLIWHKLNKDPAAAVEIVTKAVKHRIISLKSYGETPFSTIKQVLEKEDNELIQVSQSKDDVWICFFAEMEAELTARLSQLNEEYEIDYECVSLKKDVYTYYMEFCQEDFKAFRNDHKVEIELKKQGDDTYELFVRGTRPKVKAILDIFANSWRLVSKDVPMEEDNLAFFRTSEGAAFLKSIQSKNNCILSVVDNTEAEFDASFQDGPREICRHSPKSSNGKRTVTVVTGKPKNWPSDILMVPVWDVPQLPVKMSSFEKLGSSSQDDDSQQTVFAGARNPGAIRITARTTEVIQDAFAEAMRYLCQMIQMFLECPVCVKHFNQTDRRPRLLHSCLHAFCTHCLEQLLIKEGKGQITCPSCHQVQRVKGKVATLPLDPVRDKLVTCSKIKENQQVLCGECEKKDAISRCQDCKSNLCTECDFVHKRHRMSKDHSIMSLDEAQKLPVKSLSKGHFCLSHPKHQFEFYCATEDQLCCVACVAYDHRSHDLQKLERAAATKQQETEITIEEAHFMAERLKEAKLEDARQEKIILEAKNKSLSDINMLFDKLVKILDDRKRQLKAAVNEKSSNFLSAVEKTKAANDQTLAIVESTDTYFTQAKEKADVVEMLQMYPAIKRSVQDLQQPQTIPRFAEHVTDFRFQKHKSDEVMTFVTDLGAFGTPTKGLTVQSIWNKKDLDNYIIGRLHDQSFTDTDIMSLKEKHHITDTVLDAVLEDMKKPRGNVHHVNTQSWNSIFDGQYGQPNTRMNHDKVKFLDFKKVYGVINPSQKHWIFVGIDIENCRVIYLNPSGSTPKDRKQALENWSIYMERRCKLGLEGRQVKWTCDEMRQDKQMDSSNCGIICWMYAQRFLERGTYTDLPDCELLRLKVATSFLENCEKLDRRSCIACGSDEDNGMVECEQCGRRSHRKCMPERERYQAFVCKTCKF